MKDPRRLVFAIFERLGLETEYFDESTANVFRKYLDRGSLKYELDVDAAGSSPTTVKTFSLFEQIKDLPRDTEQDIADISYSFVHSILRESNLSIKKIKN